ncbi:MAG TPA: asparagine synthase (glutamine-hydrolyzing) [Blastocatellia bacterium]|jgi:asparagine synthase (glutamine-hydrolysing)|nr:asparagine synthase (glutamine-hydrolyzing) [Blastocatellia bacterium]
MCGIVGSVNWADVESLARMNNVQAHRGPDDDGLWEARLPEGGIVGLGSRRLAILDVSPAGHMPMSTPDGRLTMTYNGEVYNSPSLRRDLESKGYRFRSRGDTEVVLYLYQEYGPESLRRLNGMFALAIWDDERKELFFARDHFGIKPLYYCHQNDRLAFASEIKALLEVPGMPRRINFQALHQYLTFLWVPDPLTMFDEVVKLPAGHYALYRDGRLRVESYWDLRFPGADHVFKSSEAELAEELRGRFSRSVKAQLLSDVPVGSFLSAGLDSSSIVAAMSEADSEPTRTYTIAFPQKYRRGEITLDDTDVARRTASHFGCDHTEIVVEPDVTDLLPRLVYHMDEPVADPAIITAYLVNREARKTVTVLLSGVGGDELFAGYRKHAAYEMVRRYQRIPGVLRQKLIEPLVLALPSLRGTPVKGHVRLGKKMARSGSLSPREYFLMNSTYLTDGQKATLYAPGVSERVNGGGAWSRHLDYFEQVRDADFLNQMLYLDTKAFMASLNLTYNDKMSMASSVEVRVPFLDWELAEWVAWNVPPGLKLHNGTTKHILREAMRPALPAEVLTQKKAGFGAPSDYWLANDLKEMVDDLLNENNLRRRELFNPPAVRKLIDEQRSGRQDWSAQVWQFLTLELWMRTFLDQPVK